MAISDLKVGTRMSAGFGLILLLMISTMVITFWSLNKVDDSTALVIEESLPHTLAADQMVLAVTEVNQWITDASLTQNDEGLAIAKERSRIFKENSAKFRKMFEDEKATQDIRRLDELNAAFDELLDTGTRMAAAYKNEGLDAGNLVMEELDADSALVKKLVSELQ